MNRQHSTIGIDHSLFEVSITRWGLDEEGIWIRGAIRKNKQDRLKPIGDGKYAIGEAVYIEVDDLMYHEKYRLLMAGYVPDPDNTISAPWVKYDSDQYRAI